MIKEKEVVMVVCIEPQRVGSGKYSGEGCRKVKCFFFVFFFVFFNVSNWKIKEKKFKKSMVIDDFERKKEKMLRL